jgi:hypothetical protein
MLLQQCQMVVASSNHQACVVGMKMVVVVQVVAVVRRRQRLVRQTRQQRTSLSQHKLPLPCVGQSQTRSHHQGLLKVGLVVVDGQETSKKDVKRRGVGLEMIMIIIIIILLTVPKRSSRASTWVG